MNLKGNAARYGVVAVVLHWISAAAVLLLLILGFCAARSSEAAQAAAILRLHVPLGLLVLALTFVRLIWWQFDHRPVRVSGPRWQMLAARANHWALYGLLIVMGLSGIGLMVASGAAPILFGGAERPLPEFDRFAPMAGHALGAFAVVALLAVHLGAVLYHQLYRHDHLLGRMALHLGRR